MKTPTSFDSVQSGTQRALSRLIAASATRMAEIED
jgi:hypothetical protein